MPMTGKNDKLGIVDKLLKTRDCISLSEYTNKSRQVKQQHKLEQIGIVYDHVRP